MKTERPDLRSISQKSVDELEGYSSPPSPVTNMVQDVLAARKVPLADLTPSQIRLLISQRQGTKYLLPYAVALLEKNPWIEADFYPGDLLAIVSRVDPGFWPPGNEWRPRVLGLFRHALTIGPTLDEYDRNATVENEVRQVLDKIDGPAA